MHSNAFPGHAGARKLCFAAAIVLGVVAAASASARAQVPEDTTSGSINLEARAGLVGGGPAHTTVPNSSASPFEFSARGGFASDYIYRGTTLSAHRPAVGAAFEATAFGFLYTNASVASVKLPSQPSSEV